MDRQEAFNGLVKVAQRGMLTPRQSFWRSLFGQRHTGYDAQGNPLYNDAQPAPQPNEAIQRDIQGVQNRNRRMRILTGNAHMGDF